jgi:hypothetical protein
MAEVAEKRRGVEFSDHTRSTARSGLEPGLRLISHVHRLTDARQEASGQHVVTHRGFSLVAKSVVVVCSSNGNAEQGAQAAGRAKLRNSTTVFLVGNIEPTMDWYKQLGFESEYYPPGFASLRRDEIEIFLQQQPGYVAPDDLGRRERHAWNVCTSSRTTWKRCTRSTLCCRE